MGNITAAAVGPPAGGGAPQQAGVTRGESPVEQLVTRCVLQIMNGEIGALLQAIFTDLCCPVRNPLIAGVEGPCEFSRQRTGSVCL